MYASLPRFAVAPGLACQCRLSSARSKHAPARRPLRQRAVTDGMDLPMGSPAPSFILPEPLTGRHHSLSELNSGKAILIIFACNHCPFVVHLRQALIDLAHEYQPKGVQFVSISSNSPHTHPQDGPEQMAEEAQAHNFPFPYLYDGDTQEVAKAFRAACTPEFFLFDNASGGPLLAYHGQFDSSRPSKYYDDSAPVTGEDLRAALDAVLAGEPVPSPQVPSIGCNIKWTPGNEPAWFGAGAKSS
ncbi:unnamed protein product [Pedinophyceae sp. YPF-701]|nr:unnamed protein product [Pedinophyceae sp. YPF-701]